MELINDGIDKINMLKNRDLERQINIQKKKESKNLITADNEKIDFFENVFMEKQANILDLIKNSSNIPEADLPHHFNQISTDILLLQKYIAASNIFLRNYDIKKFHNILHELTDRAKLLEDKLLPKKKFGFKKKSNMIKTTNGNNLAKDETDFKVKISQTIDYNCGFLNRTNETLIMAGETIHKKDVSLENLNNCKVVLKGTPSTLHLTSLENCKIFCGPVSTSIFAKNCTQSTLVIACQQLRLHSSKYVEIYLHITSRGIMEDCSNISIAPYNLHYEHIEKDFEEAGLNIEVNNWKCIDDFNWLNLEKHSPNWVEIKEEDQVKSWNIE